MRDETLDDYLERNNLFLCRQLTDEEIALIWANYEVPMTGMDFKKVVEAILQKVNYK